MSILFKMSLLEHFDLNMYNNLIFLSSQLFHNDFIVYLLIVLIGIYLFYLFYFTRFT